MAKGQRIFAVVPGLRVDKDDGTTDITSMEESKDDYVRQEAERAKVRHLDIVRQQSPAGTLGLPEKLDEARLKHGIIDGAFDYLADFERIFIWQLPEAQHVYKGGNIVIPDMAQNRIDQETPKGILVSAGLGAMDYLWAHGIELGDKVMFIRMAPWRITCGFVNHTAAHLIVLHVADLVGNTSKRQRVLSGDMALVQHQGNHLVEDSGGMRVKKNPEMDRDYGG